MTLRSLATLLGATLLLGMPAPSLWAEDLPLFQCRFANGKSVTLTAKKGAVSYRFGRAEETPELALVRPYREISVTPWPGIGRTIWEDLSLTNGGYTYRIWAALDKMKAVEDAGDALRAGLIVEQGDSEIARLDCLPQSIAYTVFAFADAYEAAGYCWRGDAWSWRPDDAEICE